MQSNFFEQYVKEATRVTSDSATLIDHIWVNSEELNTECQTLPGVSDHKLIEAVYDLKIQRRKNVQFSCRSYKGFNRNMFQRDLDEADWDFLEGNNIEDIWDKWRSTVLCIIEKHTRQITYTQGKNCKQKPWMNGDLLQMIRKKQAAIIRKDYMD